MAARAVMQLGPVVRTRLQTQMDECRTAREMQWRSDAWHDYRKLETQWLRGCTTALQAALRTPAPVSRKLDLNAKFELVGEEVVESQILGSRLALSLLDKVSWELNDLRLRIQRIEDRGELSNNDVLRPETLAAIVVDQWLQTGQTREAWGSVQEAVQNLLGEQLLAAYHATNKFLIEQNVMAEIDLRPLVKRTPGSGPSSSAAVADAEDQQHSSDYGQGVPQRAGHAVPRGGLGQEQGFSGPQAVLSGRGAPGGQAGPGGLTGFAPMGRTPGGVQQPAVETRPGAGPNSTRTSALASNSAGLSAGGAGTAHSGIHDETRLMTNATPLARVRMRAQGVMGQLRRLLSDKISGYEETQLQAPTENLVKAVSAKVAQGGYGGDPAMEPVEGQYQEVHVARAVTRLREQSAELKKIANTSNEKATIEIVALMFQSILSEERIPASIRVWFARLQMPVLRVALAEPEFFSSLQHPARRLIDRMGSCVLGFDALAVGSGIEVEIKRVVQVIEQYPETGRRVFQLVYDEFQRFLSKFLTDHGRNLKVVTVAQQVEQKETLAIQYTIELRNMLGTMPIRDEVREFLFKVWAEVLAVAAVRNGPQHEQTLEFKQAAADLVWAVSAKPERADRARVIQDLPKLLQKLRQGMTILSLIDAVQDQYIKSISQTLADAFMSKTDVIEQSRIDDLGKRLVNLEDYLSDEGVGDLPLDAESIELLLGIDATHIQIITQGGSEPTEAMRAWAAELQLGSWFSLDHNSQLTRVQFAWRSTRGQLHLFATPDQRSYLFQSRKLAAYLQAGLLVPIEDEALTVRATRDALAKLDANPDRLLN